MGSEFLLVAAAILLIAALTVTSIRNLRILALVAGILAMVHFGLVDRNWIALGLAALFVAINGGRLASLLRRARQGAVLEHERELFEHVMQIGDPARQNRLRDLISWYDIDVGDVLMREGDAQPPLIYVASGQALIDHGGQRMGHCSTGDFLGEMSVISGEVASATVTASEAMRIARFDRDALADLVRTVPDMGKAIDAALNRSLAAKLLRMNQSRVSPDA